jgi:murein L,D-transpeptidase YcbB/YkuD
MSELRRNGLGYVGVGVAGFLLGILTSTLLHDSAPPEEPRHIVEAITDDMPAEANTSGTLGILKQLHDSLHEADEMPNGDGGEGNQIPKVLRTAIETDDWLADFRQAFHAQVGHGALLTATGLSPAAEVIMQRLVSLQEHAIDAGPYETDGVQAAVDAIQQRLDGIHRGLLDGLTGDERRLIRLMAATPFDPGRAAQILSKIDPPPNVKRLEALTQFLATQREDPLLRKEMARVEMMLGKTAIRLMLDFRFVRIAGPFDLQNHQQTVSKRARKSDVLAALKTFIESETVDAASSALDPPHPMYPGMLAAYDRYRKIVESGNCDETLPLPETWRVRAQDTGKRVKAIQERLSCEGYYKGPINGNYGDEMLDAVQAYQRHHELHDGGFVYEGTLKSMNVPMSRRLQQLATSLQHLRESKFSSLGNYVIRVNLPSFELQVFRDNTIVRRHRTIVGSNRLDDDKLRLVQGHINRTQLFTTRVYEVVVNPDWIVPRRIEKGEMRSKIKADPDYLAHNNIVTHTLDSGRQVYVQLKGETNALGKVKFLLQESKAIYLHDTDKPDLFRHDRRDFSHGCIRVDKALRFARWLLIEDGWDPEDVVRSLEATRTQRGMKLNSPIPLVTEYVTVDIAEDGMPIFLTDIYGFDEAYEQGTVPPEVETLWGANILRPNWVPKVDEEIVQSWKETGKAAPHDYQPGGGG